ncbi:MAG TPA: hypothetical protein VF681_13140 [Abditibacteriaceae bacterium]|jgi:hypothetical protein
MQLLRKLLLLSILLTGTLLSREVSAQSAQTATTLQANEMMLQGRIEGVSFASRQVTMSFDKITLPNGSSTSLALPRWKTVAWSQSTSFVAPPLFELPAPDAPVAAEFTPEGEAAPVVEDTTAIPPSSAPIVQALTVDALWPRKAIAVIGKNMDGGRLFSARVLEIGEPRAPLYVPATEALPDDSRFYNGVKEWVAASGLRVAQKFSIPSIGGKAARGNPTSDHPSGLALDFMVGRNAKLGDLIATYFQQYAGLENVKYIIWKEHLAYVNPRTDWSKIPVDYTGNVTARHMDHVHVSFLPAPEMPGPWLTADLTRKSRPVARSTRRRGRRAR